MKPTVTSLKKTAWTAMRSAVPPAIFVALSYYLLGAVLPEIISLITPDYTLSDALQWDTAMWFTLFLSILLNLYGTVLRFGFQCWSLRTARNEHVGSGALMDGFGITGQVILMELQILLRGLAWIILASLGISIVSVFLSMLPGGVILSSVFLILGMILAICIVLLRYRMVPYLLWDYPDEMVSVTVRRGVSLMRGNIWNLIKLYLSFWPWYLVQFLLLSLVEILISAPLLRDFLYYAAIHPDLLPSMISEFRVAVHTVQATLALLVCNLFFALIFDPYREISVAHFYLALRQNSDITPDFNF